MDANTQLASAVFAAVYLYEANYGSSSEMPYKNYVEAHYSTIEDPLVNGWWQPYCMHDENDELTLFLPCMHNEKLQLKLFDQNGKLLLGRKLNPFSESIKLIPDLQMPAGDYFVPMLSGSNRY